MQQVKNKEIYTYDMFLSLVLGSAFLICFLKHQICFIYGKVMKPMATGATSVSEAKLRRLDPFMFGGENRLGKNLPTRFD